MFGAIATAIMKALNKTPCANCQGRKAVHDGAPREVTFVNSRRETTVIKVQDWRPCLYCLEKT